MPEFRPRALFVRFKIEVLCTTDAATDTLEFHQAIRGSGWQGDVRPTFRPDAVVDLLTPSWREGISLLSEVTASITVDLTGTGVDTAEVVAVVEVLWTGFLTPPEVAP